MINQINQNSFIWHEWRSKGIGSSDIAAILGISPWTTPYQLWEIKTGKRTSNVDNPWVQRGKDMEPKARADYELRTGRDMIPVVVEHDEFPFMRASLDGWNELDKRVLEIKCPGRLTFDLAKDGKIPPYYQTQIQYQIALMNAKCADYYCFDGKEGILIEVPPDFKFQGEIIEAAKNFWKFVKEGVPPPMSDKDYVEVDDVSLRGEIFEWKQIKKQIADLEFQEQVLRDQIIPKLTHPRISCNDVRIMKVERAGTIDYKAFNKAHPEIEWEKFRKPATSTIQFRISTSQEE